LGLSRILSAVLISIAVVVAFLATFREESSAIITTINCSTNRLLMQSLKSLSEVSGPLAHIEEVAIIVLLILGDNQRIIP
jgi:hypothetical protein